MQAIEILDAFRKLEITARVNGDKLVVEPGSKLPPELVAEVRQHKSELMTLLSPPYPEASRLLSRLRAGGKWLTSQHKAWLEGKRTAVSDERFSAALEAWDLMERSLRMVFGYEGCVFGPDRRCPEAAPVVCDFCAKDKS
jgi:hypothetical protein